MAKWEEGFPTKAKRCESIEVRRWMGRPFIALVALGPPGVRTYVARRL